MADFSQQILGIASGVAQNQGAGVSEAVQQGIGLAQRAEQIQMQRDELNIKKQEVQNTRMEKFTANLMKAKDLRSPQERKGYLMQMKAQRNMWGLQTVFSDETIDSFARSDETMGRMITLMNQYKTPGTALYRRPDLVGTIANDPTKLVDVTPTAPELWGQEPSASADISKATDEINKYEAQKVATAAKQTGVQARFDESMQFKKQDKIIGALKAENVTERRQSFKILDSTVPGGIYGPNAEKMIKGVKGAEALMPTNWLSDTNSAQRQAALGIANSYLRSQAGTAQTPSEVKKIMAEMGMILSPAEGGGWTAIAAGTPTPGKFLRGMRNLEQRLRSTETRIKQYDPTQYDQIVNAPLEAPQAPAGGGFALDPGVAAEMLTRVKANPAKLDAYATQLGIDVPTLKQALGVK